MCVWGGVGGGYVCIGVATHSDAAVMNRSNYKAPLHFDYHFCID